MTIESAKSSTLSNAAVELLWRGDVIGTIKVVRQERNLGLKEAKDLVDAYIRSQPSLRQKLEQAQAKMWQKLKRGLLVVLIFAAAVAYVFFQSR
jgi:ribosomal protein L7/L12